MARICAEDLFGPEWAEWYSLTPDERFRESTKLWDAYFALEGSFDPEPDTQSPSCVFYGAAEFSRDLDLLLLLEHCIPSGTRSGAQRVDFWLREFRTPGLLVDVAGANPERARQAGRPAVDAASRAA
jgi:hypothetical protein